MYGLATSVRGGFSRQDLESLEPEVYLSGYYERWMVALERGLIERGVLTAEELEAKTRHFRENADARPTRIVDPAQTERVRAGMYRQRQLRREPDVPPAFALGDRVRARRIEHGGHTRSPRYVQGKRGVVAALYGAYNFPDAVAGGVQAPPQQLYNVRFMASELWGESAEPGGSLQIDMWESYLEPEHGSAAEERSDT
jgi:nitrile hydratase